MADLLPDPDTILSTMIAPTLDVLGDRVVRCEGEERLNYWSAFKVSTMHDTQCRRLLQECDANGSTEQNE
jgi:hypothetical protein